MENKNEKTDEAKTTHRKKSKPSIYTAIIAGIFSVCAIIISSNYNKTIQKISTNQRYVELAIKILRDKPSYENMPLREWATTLLNVCAPGSAKLDSTAIRTLLEQRIYIFEYRCPDGSLPDWDGNCPPYNKD